jgi:hypothetical protein
MEKGPRTNKLFCVYAMKTNLTILHLLQVAIGTLSSLLLMLVSFHNIEHKQALAVGRMLLGSMLFSFCLAHLHSFRRYGVNLAKVISFSPIFFAFLYTFTLAWIGHSKGWAPATSDETHVKSVKWLTLTGAIAGVGIYSVIYKPK